MPKSITVKNIVPYTHIKINRGTKAIRPPLRVIRRLSALLPYRFFCSFWRPSSPLTAKRRKFPLRRSLLFFTAGAIHTAGCAVAGASARFILFVFHNRKNRNAHYNKQYANRNNCYCVLCQPCKHNTNPFLYILIFLVSLVASLYFLKKSI